MDDYRDRWCQFFSAALAGVSGRTGLDGLFPISTAAKHADEALEELKKRDKQKAFDVPDKGYRG